jgi:phosphoribosylanthranilate isomerase
MRVKICGITNPTQAKAIADLGADTLGFICVNSSRRYVNNSQIKEMVEILAPKIKKIGVFVNVTQEEIKKLVEDTGLTGVQLHGEETPQFCRDLRQLLPSVEIIKAIRVQNQESLWSTENYVNDVDTLLLDAYDPQRHGGTGKTLNWDLLKEFYPPLPWLLAGGLTPNNIALALKQVRPNGIDLSSGVERSPGDKDLTKVGQLFSILNKSSFLRTIRAN